MSNKFTNHISFQEHWADLSEETVTLMIVSLYGHDVSINWWSNKEPQIGSSQ